MLSVFSRIFKQRWKIKRNASKSDTVNLNKVEGEGLHSKPRMNFVEVFTEDRYTAFFNLTSISGDFSRTSQFNCDRSYDV